MTHVMLVPGTVKQGYLVKSPPLEKNMAVFKVSVDLFVYSYHT